MPTRMIHPEHGAMHAYNSDEIARLERLGWAVEKPAVIGTFAPAARNGTPVDAVKVVDSTFADELKFYASAPVVVRKYTRKAK